MTFTHYNRFDNCMSNMVYVCVHACVLVCLRVHACVCVCLNVHTNSTRCNVHDYHKNMYNSINTKLTSNLIIFIQHVINNNFLSHKSLSMNAR